MQIGEFTLQNAEKENRAIYGISTRAGVRNGGVGEGEGKEWEAKLIAEYDRLGGLILKGNDKVKTGCFYDFEKRQVIAKPQVTLLFRVNDQEIEVPDGEPLPIEVRAAKIADEKASKAPAKGKAKSKGKPKEDDDEVDA